MCFDLNISDVGNLKMTNICHLTFMVDIENQGQIRIVHGSLFLDPTQRNVDPTRPPAPYVLFHEFHEFNIQVANREQYTIVARFRGEE